jgi:hypothetical protein
VSEIIGVKAPEIGYGFYQPIFAQRPGPPPSPASLRKEVGGLSQRVDDILARIGKLGRK